MYGNVSALSKIFNPDVAVIGNFVGTGGSNPRASAPALSLQEVETSLQAVVDPYARADFFVGITPDGVDIEEGYITFPTLPGGLLMKAGKLRSAFGKVNPQHSHLLPWTDRPMVVANLLGGEDGMAGATSRWPASCRTRGSSSRRPAKWHAPSRNSFGAIADAI